MKTKKEKKKKKGDYLKFIFDNTSTNTKIIGYILTSLWMIYFLSFKETSLLFKIATIILCGIPAYISILNLLMFLELFLTISYNVIKLEYKHKKEIKILNNELEKINKVLESRGVKQDAKSIRKTTKNSKNKNKGGKKGRSTNKDN